MKNLLIALITVTAIVLSCTAQNKPDFEKPINILVFSKTAGFRHESISSGLKMLYDQSKKQNWVITATENAALINDEVLANIDVVVFLNPTGDAVDAAGQAAFEKFIKTGKGFVGIHAAAD